MAAPAINPLAMALVNGGYGGGQMSGINPMSMDPSFLTLQPQLQMGQGMIQSGEDSSAAYPMQALARALQGLTGAYMMKNAAGKLTAGMSGGNNAGDAAIVNVLGGADSKLGQAYLNGDYYTRYAIKSQIGQLAVEQGKPQVVSPGQDVKIGPDTVSTNTGPQTDPFKAINDFNHSSPDQRAITLPALAKQLQDGGYQFSVAKDGTIVAGRIPGSQVDPGVIAQNAAAGANAVVPAHNAETAFKGAVDVGVANNSPQKTAPGEQIVVDPSRVPMPGASVPAVPAIAMPPAQPVVPPSGVATPAVQPAMPAQPAAPPVVPQAVQQGAPAEVPQLRPDMSAPNLGPAGAASAAIPPALAVGATPLAPPPQGASPAMPVPPPVVPAAPPAITPPTPAEIKQSGGETITGNPYPPADILKGRYDQYNKLSDAAGQAREEGQKAQLLQQKLDQLGMGGPGVPFLANLTRFAQEAGVTPETIAKFGLPNGATEEQANKLSIDLLGEVLKAQFPQRITNNDIVLFKKTVAGPGLMPESSKFLIDNIVMPKVQRDIDRFGSVVDLPGKDRALDTFNRALFDFDNKHPLSSYTPSLQPAKPPVGAPDGAKQAPDGNWYVPDPARQGKYLKVVAPNG